MLGAPVLFGNVALLLGVSFTLMRGGVYEWFFEGAASGRRGATGASSDPSAKPVAAVRVEDVLNHIVGTPRI